jgi:hypothetical protein
VTSQVGFGLRFRRDTTDRLRADHAIQGELRGAAVDLKRRSPGGRDQLAAHILAQGGAIYASLERRSVAVPRCVQQTVGCRNGAGRRGAAAAREQQAAG